MQSTDKTIRQQALQICRWEIQVCELRARLPAQVIPKCTTQLIRNSPNRSLPDSSSRPPGPCFHNLNPRYFFYTSQAAAHFHSPRSCPDEKFGFISSAAAYPAFLKRRMHGRAAIESRGAHTRVHKFISVHSVPPALGIRLITRRTRAEKGPGPAQCPPRPIHIRAQLPFPLFHTPTRASSPFHAFFRRHWATPALALICDSGRLPLRVRVTPFVSLGRFMRGLFVFPLWPRRLPFSGRTPRATIRDFRIGGII